jgi:hypothetical protein
MKNETETKRDSTTIIWGRCQNMVAIICFSAVVIVAPGQWKWAAAVIVLTYLVEGEDKNL